MEVGLRVVRGPDWQWGNQDGGEGHLGTVVEIGMPGSTMSPDKTVVIQWDSGSRTNYRVGYQGAFDLRIFDNAPVGVKHPNIICDACASKKQGIQGLRWKCTKCHDFDLCTLCYMLDKHDKTHSFLRFDTVASTGVKVSKRTNAIKCQIHGICPGARVVRGPDWDWANQDGGEGKVGKVIDIRGWDSESGRSVANVTWTSGSTNVYRVGHKGKADLKYIQEASGGYYYKEQLPVLGAESAETAISLHSLPCHFKVGDKVRVDLDGEILKVMQEGHGGWNPKMAEYIGCVGSVHRITERGDVRVQYEGCANRWTFHAGALTKVFVCTVGDIVRVSDNCATVRELQKGHGEWTDLMKVTLGKVGQVLKVYADGDLRVSIVGETWTLNPACCAVVPHGAFEFNNTLGLIHEREEPRDTLRQIMDQFMDLKTHDTSGLLGPDRLVREAAQGHTERVREIITQFPDHVDQQSSGKTALQVSSHQGHRDIAQSLLAAGANLELQDEDGDTALHYSAFGNRPEITDILLQKGAQINSLNNGGCSTLHVAVNKQHMKCVHVLLRYRCDVNIQDAYGDTALHDAIGKENREIIEQIISAPDIDFTLPNKRGFNVLHHSSLKGNNFATELFITLCRQIVDIKKDDGFSALHLAALNGHREVTSTLLTLGQANIEIRNNRQQTPLLLAVSQGHTSLIELLVTKGADVNVEDEDGDTCLHLALMRQTVATETENSPMLDAIRSQLNMPQNEGQTGAAIACYLAQQGAQLWCKNHQGKTPMDLINDPRVEEVVRQFAMASVVGKTDKRDTLAEIPECLVCSEKVADIIFQPCNHRVACIECCLKMRRCLQCKEVIHTKLHADGRSLDAADDMSEYAAQNIQDKLKEQEEKLMCSICMERKRDMAFLCGHMTCSICGAALKTCHMCRKPITKKITLFE